MANNLTYTEYEKTLLLNRNDNSESSEPIYEKTYNARALPIGVILNGQYRLDSILGEGGFGITYLCFDIYLKINVAIKEYFPAQYATRNTLQGNTRISVISGECKELFSKGLKDYEYEANRLSKFSDLEGIVSVLNFFFENNTAYMVMEYIDGISLKEYLRRNKGKIPWQEVLDMMHPVINSLQSIHKSGIIHRDISPDNIMVDNYGKITIIDFGAARNSEDEKTKTIMLKKGYAPPEQYYKNGNQGSWTDIYALCATMYQMITGIKLPDSLSIQTGQVKYELIKKYAPSIPKYFDQTIYAGIRTDINERIQNAIVLEEYLYKNRRINRFSFRKFYRHKLLLFIVTIILILVVLVFGIFIIANNEKSSEKVIKNTENMIDYEDNKMVDSDVGTDIDFPKEDNQLDEIPQEYAELPVLSDDLINYDVVNDSVVIWGIDASVTECTLPSEIDGIPVKEISGIGVNITKLSIPEGIEVIGEAAFRNCVYLESIYIPSSVNLILDKAFDNCLSLSNISIATNNNRYHISDNTLYDSDGMVIWKGNE